MSDSTEKRPVAGGAVKIPLSRPPVPPELADDIARVLRSRRFILGDETRLFEAELAAHTGVEHAVACSSGTAALWMAYRALGVRPGDEVLVPAHTAFPTIEPLLLLGARPVFCEVDETYTIDPEDARRKRTSRTVGVVAVHLYGHPADVGRLRMDGLWLLEDCAQAQGAEIGGRRVGTFGDVAVFSFFPSKNLTVLGDGGALATHDGRIAAEARRLRDHGRDSKYEHQEAGMNLRLSEIHAAIGRRLLARLDDMNAKRRTLADFYYKALAGLPLALPPVRSGVTHVYHLFVVRCERRDDLAAHLRAHGIETGIHYPVPNHRQPAVLRAIGPQPALPNTDRLVGEILSLPLFPDLDWREAGEVAAAVRSFFA